MSVSVENQAEKGDVPSAPPLPTPVSVHNGDTTGLPRGDSIFDERKLPHPTNDLDTLVHLIKGSLGAGILAMPLAFKNAGLSFGLVGTFFIGFVCTHCVHALVETSQELCKILRVPHLSYGSTAEAAFLNGPKPLRRFAMAASHTVTASVSIVAIGGCSVYVTFIASNVQQVIDTWTGYHFPHRGYIALALLPIMVLCWIRNLKLLAPFSFLSNVLIVTSLGIIMYYVIGDLPPSSSRPGFSSVGQLPAFFSTAVFALEGIGVIMPLENNMQNPQSFTGCFRVLNTAMCVVIALYATVGYFGYLRFGSLTTGSISLNLANKDPLSQASKLMVAMGVGITYPLQMYVPVNAYWGGVARRFGVSGTVWRGPFQPEHIFRLMLILITGCVALVVPSLDALMGLIGAVCLSTAGIILPAIVETVYRHDKLGRFKWILWKNLGIIIFGTVGMITGVWTSIMSIVDQE